MSHDKELDLPKGVYYSVVNDNFYSADGSGMGEGFYLEWRARWLEFPTSAITPTIQPTADTVQLADQARVGAGVVDENEIWPVAEFDEFMRRYVWGDVSRYPLGRDWHYSIKPGVDMGIFLREIRDRTITAMVKNGWHRSGATASPLPSVQMGLITEGVSDADKRDAERYRLLRDRGRSRKADGATFFDWRGLKCGDELDAAVDAARAAAPQGKE
jgi:hypothetical protein